MAGHEQRLKELRKEHKLSGTKVAALLAITPQYYYDIEKGERRLTTEIAGKLSKIFNTSVDYLIGVSDARGLEEDNKNPDPHEESELADIPIEKLNQYTLSYKGHTLSKEEADDVIELLEAALKRWKK